MVYMILGRKVGQQSPVKSWEKKKDSILAKSQ